MACISCPQCGAPAETLPPHPFPLAGGDSDSAAGKGSTEKFGAIGPGAAAVDTTPSQAVPARQPCEPSISTPPSPSAETGPPAEAGKAAESATVPPQKLPTLDQLPKALVDHPRYRVLALLGSGGMGAV